MTENTVQPMANGNGTTAPENYDPFDPANLRLDMSFTGSVGVKRLLTTVPVRKPNKQEFVRVNPNPEYQIPSTAILELQTEREIYMVTPQMVPYLEGQYAPVSLLLAVTRQKLWFLWPIKLPTEGNKQLAWHQSMAEAANRAMKSWVRIRANMPLGAYDIDVAMGNLGDPEWPDLTFREILKIAFKDRIIEDENHPVVKQLFGQV